MLGDLVELATTVVNPDHLPDIQPHSSFGSSSRGIMASSRRRKSQSVSSNADANGMLPPTTPASKVTPGRTSRSRSTTSPPGSPRPAFSVPSKTVQAPSPRSLTRFAATIALSIVSEGILHSLCATFLGTGELAALAKQTDSWVDIIGLFEYKILLLALYWFGGFDAFDVLTLTLLISTPTYILQWLFYGIHPSTIALTAGTTVLSHALPYLLFRTVAPAHKKTRTSTLRMRNRSILTDPYTTLATSLLGTTIFAVLLQLSFQTFLPSFLIQHFTGLRTLEAAHEGPSGLPALLVALLPAGWAAMEFLFAPSTAATVAASTAPAVESPFDTVRSGFWAHVYWNIWGWYTVRQKELIWRAAVLGALVVAETVVHCYSVMEGVTFVGALGYAGVWGGGVALLGAALDWVGAPSD